MKDDQIDRILSNERGIAPSFGFVGSVMDAVRSEASGPPPIPFPWKRALPGFAAWGVLLVCMVIAILRAPAPGASSQSVRWLSALFPALRTAGTYGAGWVLLSLLVAFAGLRLSLRFAGRR
jgi:hypothetical protein